MKKSHLDSVLCIDVGNTRAKAAVFSGGRRRELAPLPTRSLAGRRRPPWTSRDTAGVRAVAVSSVVPSARQTLDAMAEKLTGRPAWFVSHRSPFPFLIDVPTPSRVGVDRLCAAAGALGPRGRHVIVVDVGSAITVDIVRAGVYRGGLIMAGPDLMLRSLGQFAEQLPDIDFSSVARPFSLERTNTRASMTLGAAVGAVGAIREAVRYLGEGSKRYRVVVTGGGGAALRPRLPRDWSWRPDAVLSGLFTVWRRRTT